MVAQLYELLELLNNSELTYEQCVEEVSKIDSAEVSQVRLHISSLLALNLLPLDRRLRALFILVEPFSEESLLKSPFASTVADVLEAGTPVEKRLVLELVVDLKKAKYLKLTSGQLLDEDKQFAVVKPEHKQFCSRVSAAVPRARTLPASFTESLSPPPKTYSLDERSLEEVTSWDLLRPVPQFMEIGRDELRWLHLSPQAQVAWDSGLQLNENAKYARVRQLLDKMEVQKLSGEEEADFRTKVGEDPLILHSIDLQKRNLWQIIERNGELFREILMKLNTNEEKSTAIWKRLVNTELTVQRLQFIFKTLKSSRLPRILVVYMCVDILGKARHLNEKDQMKAVKVKHTLVFLQRMVRVGKFSSHLQEMGREIREFCEYYRGYEEAATLLKMFNESLK